MGKFRILISIILIAAGAFLLIYWESTGREALLTEEVLVAATRIPQGAEVSLEMLKPASVLTDNLAEGALTPEDMDRIQGKTAAFSIPAGSQITADYFRENPLFLQGSQSIFALNPEWITMRSSSLRRGDLVEIYEDQSHILLGTFHVAFVKDSTESEVRNIEGPAPDAILERTEATSVISHVEIIATTEEYFRIKESLRPSAENPDINPGLILVQKEY